MTRAGGLSGLFRKWLENRLALCDSLTLTQRNVYILPTGPGFMLAITLLLLLLTSINYQLNLGYLLTFLLAGSALVGMHVGHGNLRGLTLSLLLPEPQFAGSKAVIGVALQSRRRSMRHGIGVAIMDSGAMGLERRPRAWQQQRAVGFCAAAPRPAARANDHRRDPFSAWQLSCLDGLAAGGTGTGLSGARVCRTAPAWRPGARRRHHQRPVLGQRRL